MKNQELVQENLQLRVLSSNGLSKDVDIGRQDDPVNTLNSVSSTWLPVCDIIFVRSVLVSSFINIFFCFSFRVLD